MHSMDGFCILIATQKRSEVLKNLRHLTPRGGVNHFEEGRISDRAKPRGKLTYRFQLIAPDQLLSYKKIIPAPPRVVVSGRVWIFLLHQHRGYQILPANYGGGSVTASPTKRHAFRLHLKTAKITQKPEAGDFFGLFSLRAYPIPPPGGGGSPEIICF